MLGVKEADSAIHFILYLTMLNLSSLKSMKMGTTLQFTIRIDHIIP